MKTLVSLIALNAISFCYTVPLGAVVGGGFVKQGGFAVGTGGSHAEGYVDGAGGAAGDIGASGAAGFSASIGGGGSSGGEVVKTVTVEKHIAPASHGYVGGGGSGGVSGGALFSASFGGLAKHGHHAQAEVVSEKVLDVEAEAPPPVLPAKKTVIERTVIPNYVEKRVKVPTYVEKTIRVPTYVEKTIKVPAAPTIVEKTISQEEVSPPVGLKEGGGVKVEGSAAGTNVGNVQVYHTVKARPHKIFHKEVIASGGGGTGYHSGSEYTGFGDYAGLGGGAGAAGGFRAHVGGGGGGLFDGIFNIPIQALDATKGLLNSFSGGFSAQGGVAKSYDIYS